MNYLTKIHTYLFYCLKLKLVKGKNCLITEFNKNFFGGYPMPEISKEITNYIYSLDCDQRIKNFLIEALKLEYKRDKTEDKHYFKEYDEIVKDYV